MSSEQEKNKHSLRLQQDENSIEKQKNISKNILGGVHAPEHSFAKRHSTNCGDPKCSMCGNPRKFFKEESVREKSHKQGKLWE